MAQILFRGIVKAGQFKPDDLVAWAGKLGRLEGKRVQCSVKKENTGRTMSQNRYYWGVVLATLAEWSGHDPEELHDHLKGFLGQEAHELPSGERIRFHPSTTDLTIEEFSAYVDKVIQWAGEQGVRIPGPDEVTDD